MVSFHSDLHKYYSTSGEDYISVTTLLKKLEQPKDWDAIAAKYAKKHGETAQYWRDLWKAKGDISAERGTAVHSIFENKFYTEPQEYNVYHHDESTGVKNSLSLKDLTEGIYPELLIYSHRFKIAGQSDLVKIYPDKTFEIEDYKGLALNTEIPTSEGFKLMSDIKVGDELFDGNGKITKVKHISELHNNPCYKIIFDSKEEIVCDHEHKWVIERRNYKGAFITETKNTLELIALLNSKKYKDNILRIKNTCLKTKEKNLLIDPYILGCWLGDGGQHNGRITNMNPLLWSEIERRGYKLGKDISGGGSGLAQEKTVLGLYKQLKALNLIKNKHIPDIYLRASYKQRLDLLRGLMDTDGYLHKKRNRCVMNTTNIRQALMLKELVDSLGMKANIIPYNGTGFGKKFKGYSINFKAFKDSPFLNKNVNYINTNTNKVANFRYIKKIEKVDTVTTKCISVDSEDHTYLATRNYIKTHNTDKVINFESTKYYNPKKKMSVKTMYCYPVTHLDECNWNKYQLQLSIYAYLLEQFGFKCKSLQINHVISQRDENGIIALDENGVPIILEVQKHKCEYLKSEVESILKTITY